MSDWQVGDLAVCVKKGAWRGSKTGRAVVGPSNGKSYTVTWVGLSRCGRLSLELAEVETVLTPSGLPIPWRADRFRKVRPDEHEACEDEFVILLKLSRQRVSA